MRGLAAALALATLGVAGCVFEPVALEGRVCSADSDCITGYAC
jgi:hypothetical protein